MNVELLVILYALLLKKNGVKNDAAFLLDVNGCSIPRFNMTFEDHKYNTRLKCGVRHILLQKVADRIIRFVMRKPFQACCYSYIERSDDEFLEDKAVSYTPCMAFKNYSKAVLKSDFIIVRCTEKDRVVYEDVYAFTKRIDKKFANHKGDSYNVLMIGMDSMSRTRAYTSLPETMSFFKKNSFLDFKGYHKVALKSVPNLMAVLTGGNNWLPARKSCTPDMSACNNLLIWHKFRQAGYVTAFGEDAVKKQTIFQLHHGFRTPPTHHYMMPLFIGTESENKNTYCTRRIPSALQILNYVTDLTNTYKNKKIFGLFWIRSLSRDLKQSPMRFDKAFVEFLKKLKKSGILKRTFVVFFSNHGLRNGPMRLSLDSYYDERLPMLFISAPEAFQKSYKYANMLANQNRLTSAFDLYLTLFDMMKESTDEIIVIRAKACDRCISLFQHAPEHRVCSDAGIRDEWCTCHRMYECNTQDYPVMYTVIKLTAHMQNLSNKIPTKHCTRCEEWNFHKINRIHSFSYNEDNRYYLVAYSMLPSKGVFEAVVRKNMKGKGEYNYEIVTMDLISVYKKQGHCVMNKKFEHLCVCKTVSDCV